MDERAIEQLVREVLLKMQGTVSEPGAPPAAPGGERRLDPRRDYPLAQKRPDLLRTATGKRLQDITLEAVMAGQVEPNDVRITPETLFLQAEIAEGVGRVQLANNLRRAAELTRVPDERILEMYNALRPRRSSKSELLAMADELEGKYGAKVNAAFVREAAGVYERRGILRDSGSGGGHRK